MTNESRSGGMSLAQDVGEAPRRWANELLKANIPKFTDVNVNRCVLHRCGRNRLGRHRTTTSRLHLQPQMTRIVCVCRLHI